MKFSEYAEVMEAEYAECPEHGGPLDECEWIHEIRYQVITGADPFAGIPYPPDDPF